MVGIIIKLSILAIVHVHLASTDTYTFQQLLMLYSNTNHSIVCIIKS